MSDLVAFLRARLDEEAKTARTAGEARIAWLTYRDDEGQMLYTTVASAATEDVWIAAGAEVPAPASALVVYDPVRTLREVEAKRMLIDELIEGVDEAFGEGSIDHNLRYRGPSTSIDEETGELEEIPEWNVTRQLRLFALPHDTHPDYREEWRP